MITGLEIRKYGLPAHMYEECKGQKSLKKYFQTSFIKPKERGLFGDIFAKCFGDDSDVPK